MAVPRAFLKVVQGSDREGGWELDGRETYEIGRSRKCAIQFTDPTVSGVHARIACKNGVWCIADLRSSHGTVVNEHKIQRTKPLFDRDRIRLGKTQLEFREYSALAPEDLAELDRGVELLP